MTLQWFAGQRWRRAVGNHVIAIGKDGTCSTSKYRKRYDAGQGGIGKEGRTNRRYSSGFSLGVISISAQSGWSRRANLLFDFDDQDRWLCGSNALPEYAKIVYAGY